MRSWAHGLSQSLWVDFSQEEHFDRSMVFMMMYTLKCEYKMISFERMNSATLREGR